MNIQDLLENFRLQFNNVSNDDKRLEAIMLEIFIDIQNQTNIFKKISKLNLIGPSIDPKTKERKEGKYLYNCKSVFNFNANQDIVVKLQDPTLKTDIDNEMFLLPNLQETLVDKAIVANRIFGVYNKEFGRLANAVLKDDWLILDKDKFDFNFNPYCYILGSVIVYNFTDLNVNQFLLIKEALYWGTLDRLMTSVSNINNFQMENIYYQRYYQAIKSIMSNNTDIIDVEEYNYNINKFE